MSKMFERTLPYRLDRLGALLVAGIIVTGCAPSDSIDSSEAKADAPVVGRFKAMTLGVLLPATNSTQIAALPRLDATPASLGVGANEVYAKFGVDRGLNAPIMDKPTFEAFRDRGLPLKGAAGDIVRATPPFESWRITTIRPLLCARQMDAKQIDPSAGWPGRCVVEHRLVAQPLNEKGDGFLPYAMHVISRPFDDESKAAQNQDLASAIASDLVRIQDIENIDNAKLPAKAAATAQLFGVHAAAATDPMLLQAFKHHIGRFYGGNLLSTLAYMGQKDGTTVFFSGASFKDAGLAPLIRPKRDARFQVITQGKGGKLAFDHFKSKGDAVDIDPHTLITPDARGKPSPSMEPFLKDATAPAAIDEVASIENPEQIILPSTDCASCHHATAAVALVPDARAKVAASKSAFKVDASILPGVDPTVLQRRATDFVNFGYAGNQASISQETINDIAQQAQFANNFAQLLLKP
jgi:hypothetical protein